MTYIFFSKKIICYFHHSLNKNSVLLAVINQGNIAATRIFIQQTKSHMISETRRQADVTVKLIRRFINFTKIN